MRQLAEEAARQLSSAADTGDTQSVVTILVSLISVASLAMAQRMYAAKQKSDEKIAGIEAKLTKKLETVERKIHEMELDAARREGTRG